MSSQATNHPRRPRMNVLSPSLSSVVILTAFGVVCFFAGTIYTMQLGFNNCPSDNSKSEGLLTPKIEALAQKRLLELQRALPRCKVSEPQDLELQKAPLSDAHFEGNPIQFPSTMGRYLVGAARTSKVEFFDLVDPGVPMDPANKEDSDVLVLYQRIEALPNRYSEYSEPIPSFEVQEALQNCESLNIILADHSKGRNQCLAIVPQYESYVIQKWLRIPEEKSLGGGIRRGSLLNPDLPLRMVGRGLKSNGFNEFVTPVTKNMRQSWEILSNYFATYDDVLAELKPLVEKVATPKKTVTVMVCNFGQSELLVNFACAAKSREMDLSSILVFATDEETKALAESLGLTAYYDERNFGSMPQEAAGQYGDRRFTAMMMAKVFCVHMVIGLKYNILFQDVDIVWYKNPIPYFESQHLDFDLLFQDDGGHTLRYTPYSANSGFYYVRYNAGTEYLFNSLLLAGDLILKTESHQQALIAKLTEHSSLFGLRTKVFARDEVDFPGGYQFHQKSGEYMRKFFAGKIQPYIFHMSWTHNKVNKILFWQQMGEWYVQETCEHKTVPDVLGLSTKTMTTITAQQQEQFISTCCAREPIITCHYRDKPSKIPCKDSPPIDEGRPSFWK